MSATFDGVLSLLRSSSIADPSTALKPGGRRELEEAISRLERSGLRARVVIVPRGTELSAFHPLWSQLRLDAKDDLLLLFNGERWEARGWGLPASTINGALEQARPGLRIYYARGLVEALEGLAVAARGTAGSPAPTRSSGRFGSILLGTTGLAVMGLVGWTVVRRRRRARERARSLTEARSAAEQVFSEVILASEELPEEEARELREKASRLKDQLDAVAPSNVKALPAKEETFAVGRFSQLENELEALRSRVLSRKLPRR